MICSSLQRVIASLILVSCLVKSDELVLNYDPSGSSNWVPYYTNIKDTPGILVELIPLILAEANIEGRAISLPPQRTVFALRKGLIDFDMISPDWLGDPEYKKKYVFTDSLIPITEHFAFLPTTKSITKADLSSNQEIGTVRGYYYHDENDFNRIDFGSEKELVIALKARRVKYIIIGDLPGLYWSSSLNLPITLGQIHSDGFLHIRLRKPFAHLIPSLNNAISKLKKNGAIEKLVNKYQAFALN